MFLTVFAEASIVPRTVPDLESVSVNVEILAILIVALTKLLEEVADGHL